MKEKLRKKERKKAKGKKRKEGKEGDALFFPSKNFPIKIQIILFLIFSGSSNIFELLMKRRKK